MRDCNDDEDESISFGEALLTGVERGIPAVSYALGASLIIILARSPPVGREGSNLVLATYLLIFTVLMTGATQFVVRSCEVDC